MRPLETCQHQAETSKLDEGIWLNGEGTLHGA